MSTQPHALLQKSRRFGFGKSTGGSDQEFLAPALEVLETPPSPVRMALIMTICALVVSALGWAWFGRIDIVAIAQGKIQPTGRVKVVQSVETGRVATVQVSNGLRIKEGDILLELDPEELLADERAVTTALGSVRAEAARRRIAIKMAGGHEFASVDPVVFDTDAPMATRLREMGALNAETGQISSLLAAIEAQVQLKFAERRRVESSVANIRKLLVTLQERVSMRNALAGSQSGTRTSLIDATEALQQQEMQLGNAVGQLAEITASIEVLTQETNKIIRSFVSENTQKLGEAERQADDLAQKLVKAGARLRHMTLRAPITGTIQALTITNPGQVVSTGQDLMRVVPEGAVLEIEVYLPNKDIGFVHLDQAAIVKVDSFPFTRYGIISARVSRIATDAIPEPDAAQIEGNAARSLNSNLFSGAQRTQNLYFPITLQPEVFSINANGVDVALSAGMTVTVEIKTGNRRILEYLFSPLAEVTSEALHER